MPQSTLTRLAERLVQAGQLPQQARAHEATVVGALGEADAQALKRVLGRLIEPHTPHA